MSVKQTPVGRVLNLVYQCDCEDFYKKYLHDFVRIVHRCNHTKPEKNVQENESREYEVYITNLIAILICNFSVSISII